MRTRRSAGILACALIAATCALSLSSSVPAAAVEPVKLRLATLGGCGDVWLWWAQAKGIFQKYGLDVENVRINGGSAALAAVVSSSADVGYVNGFTTILAYGQGLPIEVISGAQETAMPPLPSSQGVWVKADSPIKSAADLAGKKLGVNEIAGINQIVTAAWLKHRGVDPASVRFAALPFPDLVPAVVGGALDAAQTPAVFATSAGPAVRSIADPFVDLGFKVVISLYVAHRDFVAKNPKAAESFHLAIKEADAQVNDPANRDALFDIVAAGCKGDAAALKKRPDNAIRSVIDMTALRRMGQLLVDQGIVPKVPDLNPLVTQFARR